MCVIMYHALVAVRAVVTTRWQCYHLEKGHFHHYGLQSSLQVKMIIFLTKINNICKHNIKCQTSSSSLADSYFQFLFPFIIISFSTLDTPADKVAKKYND